MKFRNINNYNSSQNGLYNNNDKNKKVIQHTKTMNELKNSYYNDIIKLNNDVEELKKEKKEKELEILKIKNAHEIELKEIYKEITKLKHYQEQQKLRNKNIMNIQKMQIENVRKELLMDLDLNYQKEKLEIDKDNNDKKMKNEIKQLELDNEKGEIELDFIEKELQLKTNYNKNNYDFIYKIDELNAEKYVELDKIKNEEILFNIMINILENK